MEKLVSCDFCKNRITWGQGMKYSCLHFFCEKCILHSILIYIGENNSNKEINDYSNVGHFSCLSCDKGKSPFKVNDYLSKSALRSSSVFDSSSQLSKCQACLEFDANYYCKDCNLLYCHSCMFYSHNRIRTFNSHMVRDLTESQKIDCSNCKRKDTLFSCCGGFFCIYCLIMSHSSHPFKYLKHTPNNSKKGKTEKFLFPLAKQSRNQIGIISSNKSQVLIDECDPPVFSENIEEELPDLEAICKPTKIKCEITNNNGKLITTHENMAYTTKLTSNISNPDSSKNVIKMDIIFRKIVGSLMDEKRYYLTSYTDKSGSFRYLKTLLFFISKLKDHIIVAKNLSPDQIKDGSNDILIRLENKEDQISKILTNDIQQLKNLIDSKKNVATSCSIATFGSCLFNNFSGQIIQDSMAHSTVTLSEMTSQKNLFYKECYHLIDPHRLVCYPISKIKTVNSINYLTVLNIGFSSEFLTWVNGSYAELMEITSQFYEQIDDMTKEERESVSSQFLIKVHSSKLEKLSNAIPEKVSTALRQRPNSKIKIPKINNSRKLITPESNLESSSNYLNTSSINSKGKSLNIESNSKLRKRVISFDLNNSHNPQSAMSLKSHLSKSKTIKHSRSKSILSLNFVNNSSASKFLKQIGYSIQEESIVSTSLRHTLRIHNDTINYIKGFRVGAEDYILICSNDCTMSLWKGRDFSHLKSVKFQNKCFACEVIIQANTFEILTATFHKAEPLKVYEGLQLNLAKTLKMKGMAYYIQLFDKSNKNGLVAVSIFDSNYELKILDYKKEILYLKIPMSNHCTSWHLLELKMSNSSSIKKNTNLSSQLDSAKTKSTIEGKIIMLDRNGVFVKRQMSDCQLIKEEPGYNKLGYFCILEKGVILTISVPNCIVALDFDFRLIVKYNTLQINSIVKHENEMLGEILMMHIEKFGIVLIR